MVDEEMRTDLRTGMNIDSGAAVCPLGHDARNQRHLSVEQMRHSINGDRLQRRIGEDDFLVSRSSRVPFVSGVDIRPKRVAYRWQLPENLLQYFFGFCFCCFIGRNFAEASANFSIESRVQMSDTNARGVSEIFGAHERFTAKTGKHQAHQLGARRFDGQPRGEGSSGGEIVYSASLAIGMKQFLNCVPHRRGHRVKYAPAEREKK